MKSPMKHKAYIEEDIREVSLNDSRMIFNINYLLEINITIIT